MGSEFLQGLNDVDWASLGYPEMPNWIRGMASGDRKTRLEAYGQIKYFIADIGSQSSENYGPISELLKTDMPIHLTPFLIELVQNKNVFDKYLALQALSDLATYPDLIKPTDHAIYKTRAASVFEAVKKGVPTYKVLCFDPDKEAQIMAKEVLTIIELSNRDYDTKSEDT